MDKLECRKKLGLGSNKNIILFSSSFNRQVKNAELAKEAITNLNNTSLIELKGYSKKEVALLINSSDIVLVTSFYETGPLIVKEALACNTPVVSTDVGDVKELIENLDNCYKVSYSKSEIEEKIKLVLTKKDGAKSTGIIQEYDLSKVATKIKKTYLNL